MPGPWRLRPRADETQPLGIVRQIHIDQQLSRWATIQPRTPDVWQVLDYWLDRRIAAKGGAS